MVTTRIKHLYLTFLKKKKTIVRSGLIRWQIVIYVFLFRGSGEDIREDVKIVAVDLQAMAPLPGVIQLQGDITKASFCY